MTLPSLRGELHLFPNLIEHSNFCFKSPIDQKYNCIAWAIIKNNVWVEPTDGNFDGIFWPELVPKGFSHDHLIQLFTFFEYRACNDSSFEEGFMKVALYGTGEIWSHASRQLVNGKWTSKMGVCEDIEHESPYDLEGAGYGKVYQLMKRANSSYKLAKNQKTK
jgi:hypothetical protein